jgi:hypothetical protein
MASINTALVSNINVDKWLLHQRSSCPTCGSAAYTSVDEEEGPPQLDQAKYIAVEPKAPSLKKKKGKKKKEAAAPVSNQIMVVGQAQTTDTPRQQSRMIRNPIHSLAGMRLPPLPNAGIPSAAEPLLIISPTSSTRATDIPRSTGPFVKRQSSQMGRKTFGLPPIPLTRAVTERVVDICIQGHSK